MAVRFVLGRSGTGKTTHCVEAIVEALSRSPSGPAPSLIFLVPEQATYEAERAILSSGVAGYHRLRVLSFNRLQFFLAGRNAAASISPIGRQMIVHKILRDHREQLQVFRSSALLPGLARRIAETIRELHRYNKTPEDFEVLKATVPQEKASRLSAMKFADLALVFARYSESIRGRFVDPDAQVRQACARVAQADFLKGARLWVDGFASFTGAEMALLVELLRVVEQTEIALCLDPARLGLPAAESDGLFEATERTYHELVEQLKAFKIELGKPVVLEEARRFDGCPPLAHVEKNLFRPGAGRASAGGHIRLVSAPDLRAETQFVAGQIRTLVRDRGLRYRDIAVVASDLGRYEHYIRAAFDDHGIPYFIDQRKPLDRHPVVELVTAALQAITGGFAHADVFAYLKSDLVPAPAAQVDVLENYCLAFGVDGRDWLKSDPWRFQGPDDASFDEAAIHKIRTKAIGPLLDLRAALAGANEDSSVRAADFTRAVFAFLEGLKVRQAVASWIDESHQAGDLATADEHRQFFERFVDVFDELVEVFGDDGMSVEDYLAIVSLAFSQMTLAFIPPSLDQVLVGSIERSRHPNLRAAFLLGATQKQFPIPLPSTGVLTDADRDMAEAAGFHLAPTTTQTLAERQYLAYIAFTRPSELLYISYPGVDEKGSPVVRSQFVDDLADLFDDLAPVGANNDSPLSVGDGVNAADIHTETELAEWLCTRLGRDVFAQQERTDGRLEGLLAAMSKDPDHRHTAACVLAALGYENKATLDRTVAERLFAKELRASATRLAVFAACPYQHFARYSLELRTRREFKLEPLDLGNFYHAVLDALHKRLAAERQDFATVADDRLREMLREQVEAFASHDPFLSKFRARNDHNAFIVANAAEVLGECVLDIARMARAGAFRPVLSEVAFGDFHQAQAALPALELPLPDGRILSLRGKIDRLDVAQIDGRRVALVFDYKTSVSGARFHWWRLYHGLDMQLAIYLLTVRDAGRGLADEVAGALYMPISVPPDSTTLSKRADTTGAFHRKTDGPFNGAFWRQLDREASHSSAYHNFYVTREDEPYGDYNRRSVLKPAHFAVLLDVARNRMIALGQEIASGQIEVHPYRYGTESACSSCDYKTLCRFDWQINDYRFLDPKGKLDVVGGTVAS